MQDPAAWSGDLCEEPVTFRGGDAGVSCYGISSPPVAPGRAPRPAALLPPSGLPASAVVFVPGPISDPARRRAVSNRIIGGAGLGLRRIPQRKSDSHRTRCWREMDSNHRSPARKSRFLTLLAVRDEALG